MDSDRIRALIVGVSDYDYETMPDLAMVGTDAAALADVLAQPVVGAYRVKRLDSPRASVALAEIAQQLRASRRRDTLLIYFAGYGIRAGGELFLCARDTDPGDPWRTAIPVSRLRGEIDASRLRHVMVIVDSCSASVNAETAPLDGLRGRTYTLLASTNSQPVRVVDSPGKSRMASAFTRALIDGLWRGEADYDNSGVVSLDELREFVRQRMLALSGGDPVVFMAAGPSNLRLAHSGRLTLLVHENASSAEVDVQFRQITAQIALPATHTLGLRSAWLAFADGFLSIFGGSTRTDAPPSAWNWRAFADGFLSIFGDSTPANAPPSAWKRLSGRLTDKYDQMGNPPNPEPGRPPEAAAVSTDDKELQARMVAMPTPTQAAQWEQACPGSFDRIMCEIETEERHRRRTEMITVVSRLSGQLFGFGTVIVLAVLAKYFADSGAATQGAAIIVSGAGTIVAIFVTGKLLRNR